MISKKVVLSEEEAGVVEDLVEVLQGQEPALLQRLKASCVEKHLNWTGIYFHTVKKIYTDPILLAKLRSWDSGKEEVIYDDGYGYPNYP